MMQGLTLSRSVFDIMKMDYWILPSGHRTILRPLQSSSLMHDVTIDGFDGIILTTARCNVAAAQPQSCIFRAAPTSGTLQGHA